MEKDERGAQELATSGSGENAGSTKEEFCKGKTWRGDDFMTNWTQEKRDEIEQKIRQIYNESTDPGANINDADLNLFYHKFGAKNHLSQLRSHSEFIAKSYRRLKGFFSSLTEEDILEHDRSKLSFTEMAGYTDKWVWGLDSEAWKKGLDHHYLNNPHHPQHHLTGNGDRMDMPVKHLEESIIDMVACHWERKLGGNPDVTDADLLHFDEEFLTRYTKADREKVKTYMLSPARECSKDQSAQETQVAK